MSILRGACATLTLILIGASTAGAGAWRHGPELQAGMGHWSEPASRIEGAEYRWRPTFGAGWFVERVTSKSVRLSALLGYRRVGDEERMSFDYGGSRAESKATLEVDQILLPLRVEIAMPFAPAFALEAGTQAEYALRAMEDFEPAAIPLSRAPRPFAVIFEDLSKPLEVTSYLRRLGASATVGALWRTRVKSHETTVAGRWEQGLTELWKDGGSDFERHARRATATLRVAW